jgi:hypothetical protein
VVEPPDAPIDYSGVRDQMREKRREQLASVPRDEDPAFRDAVPHLLEAQDVFMQRYWGDPNIVGIGCGWRIRDGRIVKSPALTVSVIRKLDRAELPTQARIPERLSLGRGVEVDVDVQEKGPYYFAMYILGYRPSPGGVSFGHHLNTAGTLGCLVNDTREGGLCMLSCHHVLTPVGQFNGAKRGDSVVQPGPADGGIPLLSEIGKFKRAVPVSTGLSSFNTVDAAIASVNNGGHVTNDIMGQMSAPSVYQPACGLLFAVSTLTSLHIRFNNIVNSLGVELLNGSAARSDVPALGATVQKTGRTTEWTSGIIANKYASATIQGTFFADIFETTYMGAGGDSGSVTCLGGSHTGLPPNVGPSPAAPGVGSPSGSCGTLSAVQLTTGLPVTQDQASIEEARDKYLRTTRIGAYAIDVFYENELTIRDRIAEAQLDEAAKDLARAFYGKYAGDARLALTDVDRPDLRLAEHHFSDAEVALRAARPHLSDAEHEAAQALLEMARAGLGKNARECLAILDDPELNARVREILSRLPNLRTEIPEERATYPGRLPEPPGN